ncbi:MAG: glycerol-3-phosphate responsive antiterminator, partial [Clostridia bacterium]|nr:glycerol-3-phosphate responsive antiterminator [Clostridia bacterium]
MLMRNKVIAAVRTHEELLCAADSDVKIVFDLSPDILTIEESIKILHDAGKKFFIHLDLADGIGKDRSGIEYVKKLGVDGIISTRTSIIKIARELGV